MSLYQLLGIAFALLWAYLTCKHEETGLINKLLGGAASAVCSIVLAVAMAAIVYVISGGLG